MGYITEYFFFGIYYRKPVLVDHYRYHKNLYCVSHGIN